MRGIAQRATENAVDGIVATSAAGAPRSSPEAAQRFAGGEGFNGGDPDRSTIDHAVGAACHSTEHRISMAASATPRIHTSLTDVTHPGGAGAVVRTRDRAARPAADRHGVRIGAVSVCA